MGVGEFGLNEGCFVSLFNTLFLQVVDAVTSYASSSHWEFGDRVLVTSYLDAYQVPARRFVERRDLILRSEDDEDLGCHCEGIDLSENNCLCRD